MANIELAVGQVNITTGFLIFRARKVSTPLVEEAREVFPTPLPTSFNLVLPASGDIDPVNYYVDAYESSDGISLDLLLSTFVVNAKNNIVVSETRFYQVDGGGVNPPANQDTLNDPYLDGKTITKVFKRGTGPIVNPDYSFKEYDLVAGGGIQLLNGILFDPEDIWAVEISYLAEQVIGGGNGGMYNGVITITADTTLTSTHRNKRLRCASSGSNNLVITLEDVSALPENTFFHFTQNDGVQFQTRILAAVGNTIVYHTGTRTELSIGPGEFLRIEKTGSILEATLVHPGVLQVGERFAGTWKDHPNCFPENGALYDGDNWPRIWDWISNKLPSTHKVIDDNVINGGYMHPVGKEGLFVLHSTLKKFRLPNTQKLSERGLNNFTIYNGDAERLYDYPGGVQNEMVGPHSHSFTIQHGFSYTGGPNSTIFGNGANSPQNFAYSTSNNSGTENRVKNFGVIYLRRF